MKGKGAPSSSRQLEAIAAQKKPAEGTSTAVAGGLTTRLPPPTSFSYTALNCYDTICPHQFYRRYMKRDLVFAESPAMQWGNRVHKAMERRINEGVALPADMRQWEPLVMPLVERGAKAEIKFGINEDGYPCDFWAKPLLRGKIDVMLIDSKGTRAYINDWKTGKRREDPFELRVGALALQTLFPKVEIIVGTYTWLKTNEVGDAHELSDTDDTWDRCMEIIDKIENDKIFEKRAGPLCRWCDVMDCENNRKK
jgi:PD-(D/E)XK nuclease superfamily